MDWLRRSQTFIEPAVLNESAPSRATFVALEGAEVFCWRRDYKYFVPSGTKNASDADGRSAFPASRCVVRRGVVGFKFFFHSRQESVDRFIAAPLERRTEPRFTHQTHAGMQVPGAIAAKFDLL